MTSETGVDRASALLAAIGFTPHDLTGGHGAARYGHHLVLDLEGCDPAAIDDPALIRAWLRGGMGGQGLVDRIGMVAHGDPWIESFAHDDPVTAGYTAVQLIETSSITGHFSPYLRTAHIDVFSCRWFEPQIVVAFTRGVFGGPDVHGRATFLPRG